MKIIISFWFLILIVILVFREYKGFPTADDFVPKLNVYATHEANIAKLLDNGLDFLTKDLNELYEHCNEAKNVFYDTAYKFMDYCFKQIDPLSRHFHQLSNCVDDKLKHELINFKNRTDELRKLLEQTPKSKTCYKDILIWIEDVKNLHRKTLNNSKYLKAEQDTEMFSDRINELEPFLGNHTILDEEFQEYMNYVHGEFEEFIREIEDMFNEYLNHLLETKRTGASNADLKSISKEKLEEYGGDLKEYIKDLKTDLDQDLFEIEEYVADITGELLNYKHNCYDDQKMLVSTIKEIELVVLDDIHKMELYAQAEIYLVEKENKVLVECNDHVPYDGCKPKEKFTKAIHINGTTETVTNGRDENHRYYDRMCIKKQIDNKTMIIQESITHSDKQDVVNRNYTFVWK